MCVCVCVCVRVRVRVCVCVCVCDHCYRELHLHVYVLYPLPSLAGGSASVQIHQLSKWRTQVSCRSPGQPLFIVFVCTFDKQLKACRTPTYVNTQGQHHLAGVCIFPSEPISKVKRFNSKSCLSSVKTCVFCSREFECTPLMYLSYLTEPWMYAHT